MTRPRGTISHAGMLATVLVANLARTTPAPAQPRPLGASAAADVMVPMTIAASTDANPDAAGRPSPVVLRVYQLKGDAAFRRVDFFGLFDDEQKALGADLVGREEYTLAPAESRDLVVTVSGEARFIGAVAAFRDIRNAQWRAVVPAPVKGLTIAVERARLVLFPD